METELRADGAEQAQAALRSVAVKNTAEGIDRNAAKTVSRMAHLNLASAPGSFNKSMAQVSLRSEQVVISGVLAVVAEYGMVNSHWFYWGRPVQRSPVPPPRFGTGRPKPEDGHVVGKAWKQLRKKLWKGAGDDMLKAYTISFDKHGVPKG